MPLGLYISIPFCRSKCSYCNFASGVFPAARKHEYVERIVADFAGANGWTQGIDARIERTVDSIYLGGGTPTLLEPADLERLFAAARTNFDVAPDSEITVECAPGTLSPATIELLRRCGVNRASLGVQSFVDEEARGVGRLHTREVVLEEMARLRAAGLDNISVDLIAGLPHQTAESWARSLDDVIALGVPHVSVYMLEVDEDSRLGRELIAGGQRYHAHFVPNQDAVADLYLHACERLDAAGVRQYEISNFARAGAESRHNLKYWTRQPYLGFGVDAHSMTAPKLELLQAGVDALRFSTPDDLTEFLQRPPDWEPAIDIISRVSALEETLFLGLRLNRGVSLSEIQNNFAADEFELVEDKIEELVGDGLLLREGDRLRLTPRGRLLSNEVFERFISIGTVEDLPELMKFIEETRPDEPERQRFVPLTKRIQ